MVSVHTITLGFVSTPVWEKAAKRYQETRNPDLGYKHWFVDQHYPLRKKENRAGNREVCRRHDIEVIDPGRNLGLHDGFNWALRQINPNAGDIIIAFDPDMFPRTPGWDMALVRAIRGDPEQRVAWASLWQPHLAETFTSSERRQADGYIDMDILDRPHMNSCCAFSYDWLNEVGGLTEPRAFYGHLESAMWRKLGHRQWAFLPGWVDDSALIRPEHDPEYTEYKWIHSHEQSWDGDFESWLAAGKPGSKAKEPEAAPVEPAAAPKPASKKPGKRR